MGNVAVQTITDTQNQNLTRSKQGYIEWKITGDLLQQVKNATQGQEFISPEFETIDGTKWRIVLRPLKNGITDPPGCSLKCVTLSANKAKICANVYLNVVELEKSGVDGLTFTNADDRIYATSCFIIKNLSEQIQNLPALTIQCRAEEAMDVSTNDALFEWKITKHFLQKWKNTKMYQSFR
eukprot:782428_1